MTEMSQAPRNQHGISAPWAGLRRLIFLATAVLTAVLLVSLSSCSSSTTSSANSDARPLQPGKTLDHTGEEELGFKDQLELGRRGDSKQVSIEKQSISDSMLVHLTENDDWLKTLQLDAGTVTDVGIKSIAKLTSLRHLRLRQSPVTDIGFESLSHCSNLQILNLPQCDATAEGIASLSALPKLWNLRLGGKRLNASTAQAIAKLQPLRNLHLIGVPIDDEGLRQIVSLPNLESLYIDDARISQAGWDWVFETHADLHLHVDQKHHDRDPKKH